VPAALALVAFQQDPYKTATPHGGPCRRPTSDPPAHGPYSGGSPSDAPCRTPDKPPSPSVPSGPYLSHSPANPPCRSPSRPPTSTPSNPYGPQTPGGPPCEKRGGGTVPSTPPASPDVPTTVVIHNDTSITVNSTGGPTRTSLRLVRIDTGQTIHVPVRPDDPRWSRDPSTGLWTIPIEPPDLGRWRLDESGGTAAYVNAHARIDKTSPMSGVYTLDVDVSSAPVSFSLTMTGPGISLTLPPQRLQPGRRSFQVPVNPSAPGDVVATAVFVPTGGKP
jgi:hypothetical protein